MFIINLTYKVSLDQVDTMLEDHVEYLNEQYEAGYFLASGRKNPRNGGVILAKVESRQFVEEIIKKDPFHKHDLADYELIEFQPSKTSDELKFLLQ